MKSETQPASPASMPLLPESDRGPDDRRHRLRWPLQRSIEVGPARGRFKVSHHWQSGLVHRRRRWVGIALPSLYRSEARSPIPEEI